MWQSQALYGTRMLIPLSTKSPQPIPILGQFNPVHVPISFFEYSFLIFSSHHLHLSLPSGFIPSGLATKNHVFSSPLPHSAICLAQINLLRFIARITHSYIISGISFLDKQKHRIFLLRAVEAIVRYSHLHIFQQAQTYGEETTYDSLTRSNT